MRQEGPHRDELRYVVIYVDDHFLYMGCSNSQYSNIKSNYENDNLLMASDKWPDCSMYSCWNNTVGRSQNNNAYTKSLWKKPAHRFRNNWLHARQDFHRLRCLTGNNTLLSTSARDLQEHGIPKSTRLFKRRKHNS